MAYDTSVSTRPPPLLLWGIPLLVFLVISAVAIGLRHQLEKGEHERLRISNEITGHHVAMRLESWLETRTRVVRHLGGKWWRLHPADMGEFKREAEEFLKDFSGYQAINWIDSDWVIRIIVPEHGNEPALGFDLHHHPNPEVPAAISRALQTDAISSTPIVELIQGGAGVATYQPVRNDEGLLVGFINGVFRIDRIIESCLGEPWLNEQFRFEITDSQGTVVYQNPTSTDPKPWPFEHAVALELVGQTWRMTIAPSQNLLARSSTGPNQILVACGISLGAVLALLLRVYLLRNTALRRSEARHRSLIGDVLESSAVGIIIHDADMRVCWMNRATEEFFTLSRDAVVGKKAVEMAQIDMAHRVADAKTFVSRLVTIYRRNSGFEQFECRVSANLDQPERWLEHRSQSIRAGLYAGGRIEYYYDITQHKQAKTALEESRRLLQSVMDTVPVRVFWKDRDLIYLGCNREAARDAGLDGPEEIIGKTDRDLAWRAHADLYRADDRAVIDSGEPRLGYEEPQEPPDGTRRWLRTSKIPLRDGRGCIVGVLGCYEDVTHEHALEEHLRQAQKMEAVGQLAGGVAHDFNNILTAILGNIDLTLSEMADQSSTNERIRRNLLEIEQGALRAAGLTRQLLAFARREVFQPERIDLSETLKSMEGMLRRLLTESIELEVSAAADLMPIFIGAGQIEQIVLNLAVNARDAMPDGGKLTIRAKKVEGRDIKELARWLSPVDVEPGDHGPPTRDISMPDPKGDLTGPFVRLTVEDTGSGMDDATLQRIFEPFFTTKGIGQGTGLGLATVYGIIRQSRGRIRVSSQQDRGTVFDLLFPPLEEKEHPSPAPPPDVTNLHGTETILLCEDDDSVRELAERFLSRAGYRVLVADDGGHALQLGKKHPDTIDLLVTDVIMPDTNGKVLADRLGSDRPGLKTLFISGYTANLIARHGVLDEGVNLLEKPFSRAGLLQRVRRILDRAG